MIKTGFMRVCATITAVWPHDTLNAARISPTAVKDDVHNIDALHGLVMLMKRWEFMYEDISCNRDDDDDDGPEKR